MIFLPQSFSDAGQSRGSTNVDGGATKTTSMNNRGFYTLACVVASGSTFNSQKDYCPLAVVQGTLDRLAIAETASIHVIHLDCVCTGIDRKKPCNDQFCLLEMDQFKNNIHYCDWKDETKK